MKKDFLKLFVFAFTFLFLSCQTEEILVEKKHFGKKKKIETKLLNGNEALRVKNLLNTKLSSGSKLKILATSSNGMRTSEGTIDFNSILQVIDSLGIKNYTFRIINHPDDDEKTFHNLVLTEKENELEATIMKYEMDALFAQEYYAGIKEFEEFQGRISSLSLSPSDPCEPITIAYPNTGSGNGDGGSPGEGDTGNPGDTGGGDGGFSDSSCVTITLSFGCSCGNNFNTYAGALGCAQQGDGNYTITVIISYSLSAGCRTSEDPCNPDGTIGVIEPPVSVPEMIENHINDIDLSPCSKNILDRLKNLEQSDIKKIMEKFNATKDYEVDIRAVDENLGINTQALTNWFGGTGSSRVPYNYWIKIKNDYLNQATDLSVASTILHEMVHAYFLSLIDDCNIENDCELLQSFPDLWNYYVAHNNQGVAGGISQHNQMAASYVRILAVALQEFHTGEIVADDEEPEQLYKDLAWDGLEGTIPFNNLDSLEQIRIQKVNDAERTNQPQLNISGTAIQASPVGTPCN